MKILNALHHYANIEFNDMHFIYETADGNEAVAEMEDDLCYIYQISKHSSVFTGEIRI